MTGSRADCDTDHVRIGIMILGEWDDNWMDYTIYSLLAGLLTDYTPNAAIQDRARPQDPKAALSQTHRAPLSSRIPQPSALTPRKEASHLIIAPQPEAPAGSSQQKAPQKRQGHRQTYSPEGPQRPKQGRGEDVVRGIFSQGKERHSGETGKGPKIEQAVQEQQKPDTEGERGGSDERKDAIH
jgi:hypothetical protein